MTTVTTHWRGSLFGWRRQAAWLRPVISISSVFLLWEIAAALGWINKALIPPPSAIFTTMWLQAGPIGWPCMRWGREKVEVNKDGTLRNPHTAMMKIALMIAQAYVPVDQEAKEAYLQAAREEQAKQNQPKHNP